MTRRFDRLRFFITLLGTLCAAVIHGETFDSPQSNIPQSAAPHVKQNTRLASVPLRQNEFSASRVSILDHPERRRGNGRSMTIAIPQEHSLIQKNYDYYLSPGGKKWIAGIIKRAAPYRAFIEKEIIKLDLPRELVFLPVIESSYLIFARSTSGALGLWQFMTNTSAAFNLRTTEWLDERLDPWLSTEAALKKLKENFELFGSWEMALAAYNCGNGAASRAVKKAGSDDFWYLADRGFFSSQTKNYVPKFLVVSDILTHCSKYNIEVDWSPPAEELETIVVNRPIDITLLAKKCGADQSVLRQINPALLYSITPPDMSYQLRVPASLAEKAKYVLDADPTILVNCHKYTIQSGDTLYAISKHYGVTVEMLQEYNKNVNPRTLKIGSTLIIPVFKETSPYKGRTNASAELFSDYYIVKKGDTLWSIALAYGVQIETLAEQNNISIDDILSIGKRLRVPAR